MAYKNHVSCMSPYNSNMYDCTINSHDFTIGAISLLVDQIFIEDGDISGPEHIYIYSKEDIDLSADDVYCLASESGDTHRLVCDGSLSGMEYWEDLNTSQKFTITGRFGYTEGDIKKIRAFDNL